jgi:hypothetical protein
MEKIIFFLIIFVPVSLWSQVTNIKGQILDDSTGVAIPFSTVAVKGKGIGAATGMDGTFNLTIEKHSKIDSLEFRALGYKAYYILLSDFLKSANNGTTVEVKLTPISFNLREVEVFPTKEEETFGTFANSTTGPAYSFTAGARVAVFIPNERGERGIIKSISFFFTGKRRKPTAPFRIRVLKADQNGHPEKDLLLKSVIVNAPKSDEWFTVNLEEYNLPIPENGYFAGLELIYTDKKYQFKPKNPPRSIKKLICQGPSLGLIREKKPSHTWFGSLGGGWLKFDYADKEDYCFNHMIQSTVKHEE